MRIVSCLTCGEQMKRNGTTSSGRQCWRCKNCGASRVVAYDTTVERFAEFLDWLTSKNTQALMPGEGRTFRRRTQEFWNIWPLPEVTGEVYRVIFVDGIWLERDLVVLIAHDGRFVVSWYMAWAETTRSWMALLSGIPAPMMVVCDGGSGFNKAREQVWPSTRVQRCLFHVFSQVKRYTTSRPRLLAGQELYRLALELLRLNTLDQAAWWVERYWQWCEFWADFLGKFSYLNGKRVYTHERLRKARSSLSNLVSKNLLFTYLDPELTREGPLPRTNNTIEGAVNAQLRDLLRNHRGIPVTRRIKAVYWWCYLHTEKPRPLKDILKTMPTDKDIDLLYQTYATKPEPDDDRPQWGNQITWTELHHQTPYPYQPD